MTRRRDKRIIPLCTGLFVALFAFVFLINRNNAENADAADLSKFDPGNIISDYIMSNYNSMTEAEIQKFLTEKNSCNNKDYNYYNQLSAANPGTTWHWKDNHFVCLSEELFGDGMIIGEGKTAAKIIYETAQKYKINPQVLIVLIEKESGLITDPIPNSHDYRTMTGFGCPDTAPCDSKYFGFKNQIEKAAALFREVLDGGWTNYPLGENYIQYNPNRDCGGSIVNIKNLATSSLYRYTPYQPNAAALAAGRGTAYCGAYGNRNFYSYFSDWFGDPTSVGLNEKYNVMQISRTLIVKDNARYIDPKTGEIKNRTFSSKEYFTHLNYHGKELCLAIKDGANCYLYEDLEEVKYDTPTKMDIPRMILNKNKTVELFDMQKVAYVKNEVNDRQIYYYKTYVDDELCLQTEKMNKENTCVFYKSLKELDEPTYYPMVIPRKIYVSEGGRIINLETGIEERYKGGKEYFAELTYWDNQLCLRLESQKNKCVLYDDKLIELTSPNMQKMDIPRYMKITKQTEILDLALNKNVGTLEKESIVYFSTKTYRGKDLCLGGANGMDQDSCVLYDDLQEIAQYEKMAIPRYLAVTKANYYDTTTGALSGSIGNNEKIYFDYKTTTSDGELCLRRKEDSIKNEQRCVRYSLLTEL